MNIRHYIYILAALLSFSGCGKEFLDIKRDAKQVIPKTIDDYQALLDRYNNINGGASVSLGLIGAGEYTLPDIAITKWKGMIPYEANGYLWAEDIYEDKESTDWNNAYHRILYTNLALEVDEISPSPKDQEAWNNVKGSALFFRAYSYYQLAQLFCKPYDASTAASDPGVPLKLDYDVTEEVSRGTVADVYKQIVNDLEAAYTLVPDRQINVFRPAKAAVAALLARTYLQMGNYERAGHYADLGLQSRSELTDYNALDLTKAATFPSDYGATNPEILLYMFINKPGSTYEAGYDVEEGTLNLYEEADLRRQAYFTTSAAGFTTFKASFAGPYNIFAGLSTSELWLMRAESRARLGDRDGALSDLNSLRVNRYDADEYAPATAANADEVLALIVEERRKEFYFRGITWEDLRRFNKEPQFARTLVREAFGEQYKLAPGDVRWVWPLPKNEIELNGLEQNPR